MKVEMLGEVLCRLQKILDNYRKEILEEQYMRDGLDGHTMPPLGRIVGDRAIIHSGSGAWIAVMVGGNGKRVAVLQRTICIC